MHSTDIANDLSIRRSNARYILHPFFFKRRHMGWPCFYPSRNETPRVSTHIRSKAVEILPACCLAPAGVLKKLPRCTKYGVHVIISFGRLPVRACKIRSYAMVAQITHPLDAGPVRHLGQFITSKRMPLANCRIMTPTPQSSRRLPLRKGRRVKLLSNVKKTMLQFARDQDAMDGGLDLCPISTLPIVSGRLAKIFTPVLSNVQFSYVQDWI